MLNYQCGVSLPLRLFLVLYATSFNHLFLPVWVVVVILNCDWLNFFRMMRPVMCLLRAYLLTTAPSGLYSTRLAILHTVNTQCNIAATYYDPSDLYFCTEVNFTNFTLTTRIITFYCATLQLPIFIFSALTYLAVIAVTTLRTSEKWKVKQAINLFACIKRTWFHYPAKQRNNSPFMVIILRIYIIAPVLRLKPEWMISSGTLSLTKLKSFGELLQYLLCFHSHQGFCWCVTHKIQHIPCADWIKIKGQSFQKLCKYHLHV